MPFFGIILGEVFAGIYMIIGLPAYNRKLQANNGMPVPEWRMPPAIVAGVVFAIGLLW